MSRGQGQFCSLDFSSKGTDSTAGKGFLCTLGLGDAMPGHQMQAGAEQVQADTGTVEQGQCQRHKQRLRVQALLGLEKREPRASPALPAGIGLACIHLSREMHQAQKSTGGKL